MANSPLNGAGYNYSIFIKRIVGFGLAVRFLVFEFCYVIIQDNFAVRRKKSFNTRIPFMFDYTYIRTFEKLIQREYGAVGTPSRSEYEQNAQSFIVRKMLKTVRKKGSTPFST